MAKPQRTNAGEQLIREVTALNPDLGKRLKAYLDTRSYGLVFEHNRSECMTVTGKPLAVGDRVKTTESTEPLHVVSTRDGQAMLDDGSQHDVNTLTPIVDFNQPVYCGLEETGRVTNAPDIQPSQIVIEGENYHALQALTFAYKGKIDCIYIDPPYNTGARDWRYDNDYVDATDGYRHSKWLAFMERRLNLAKKLLNPESSLLICTIDEKEVNRLGLLLEQVFGQSASIQMVSIVNNPNGVARKNQMYRVEEYAFFVWIGDAAPCALLDPPGPFARSAKNSSGACKTGAAPTVRWERLLRGGSGSARHDSPGCFYPVYIDPESRRIADVGEPLPEGEDPSPSYDRPGLVTVWPFTKGDGHQRRWRMRPENLRALIRDGWAKVGSYDAANGRWSLLYLGSAQRERIRRGEIIVTGHDRNGVAEVVYADGGARSAPRTVWIDPRYAAGEHGSALLARLLGERRFSYPKSLYAVEDCLRAAVVDKPNATVLDFFAGSGTTAHAVMRLNHADGGRRVSISITNNEVGPKSEKELSAKGLKPGDPDWDKWGICEYVTKPRVTAAITGRTPQGNPIKGRYRFNDEFDMADGFRENAVFYKLVYLDPDDVRMDCAFDEVAPLLWLRAGATGPVIAHESENGFEVNDHYGILFDFAAVNAFARAVGRHPNLTTLYAITEDAERKRIIEGKIPGAPKPIYLYEEYFRHFEISSENPAA